MTAYSAAGEYVVAVNSLLLGFIVALAVALVRLRDKVTRLDEWVRQYERNNGKGPR